jgi:hypothetical protein
MKNIEETDFSTVYTIGITAELTETSVHALCMQRKVSFYFTLQRLTVDYFQNPISNVLNASENI